MLQAAMPKTSGKKNQWSRAESEESDDEGCDPDSDRSFTLSAFYNISQPFRWFQYQCQGSWEHHPTVRLMSWQQSVVSSNPTACKAAMQGCGLGCRSLDSSDLNKAGANIPPVVFISMICLSAEEWKART